MSADAWTRWRERATEAWNRHVRYRELYRQIALLRADLAARTAWMDGLTEEELTEILLGLNACVDAVRDAGDVGDAGDDDATERQDEAS